MSKQNLLLFFSLIVFFTFESLKGYTQEELDRFADKGEGYVKKILQIRKSFADKQGVEELEDLIKERFSGGVRLGSGQVALPVAPEGQTYLLVPNEFAQKYGEKKEFESIAQEGVALSSMAPTKEDQEKKPAPTDTGEWFWHISWKKWVFVSKEPVKIGTHLLEASEPIKPIKPAEQISPTVPEKKPELSVPKAPQIPQAPGIPSAPPVTGSIPQAPGVPGAPPAPPVPGAPAAPIAPPAPGAPGANKGGVPASKPVKKALTDKEVEKLTSEQKEKSDEIYTLLLNKLSKQFPKEKEALSSKGYAAMLSDAIKKLKNVDDFVYTKSLDVLDRKMSQFFQDSRFKDLKNMGSNLETIKQEGLDLFKLLLINESTEEFKNSVERIVISLFGVARMAGQSKIGLNEQLISDSVAKRAIIQAIDVKSLKKNILDLIIDPEFVHYEPLLKSWGHDDAEKMDAKEALNVGIAIKKGQGVALKLLSSDAEVAKLTTTLLSLTVWNTLLYKSYDEKSEEDKALMAHLGQLMNVFKKDVEERKKVAPQQQKSSVVEINIDAQLNALWPQISNLIQLKNGLVGIAKKADGQSRIGLNNLVELLSKQPENQEEFKKQFETLFKDQANKEQLIVFYKELQIYFDILAALKTAQKEAISKKEEANKLDQKGGAENESKAAIIREQIFQGNWLYKELEKIYTLFFKETLQIVDPSLNLVPEWSLGAIENLSKVVNSTKKDQVIKQRALNRVAILQSSVTNARSNSLKQVLTSLYRNPVDVAGAFSEIFTKSLVSSFTVFNFDKSYFIMILEPYGVVLKIISDFNTANATQENYKMLMASVSALDTALLDSIISRKKDEYFPIVFESRQEIAPTTSLYKGRLTGMVNGLKESNFAKVKETLDKLVEKAGVGVETSLEYNNLLDTFKDRLVEIFRASIIADLESLDNGTRQISLEALGVSFKIKVSLVEAYLGQAIAGAFTSFITYIKAQKIASLDFKEFDAKKDQITVALQSKVAEGLKKAKEEVSDEKAKVIAAFIVEKEVAPVRQKLADLYLTVTGQKVAPAPLKEGSL